MNVGDRVEFKKIFELAPDPVADKLGELGTAQGCTVAKKGEREWKVWKVKFDDGTILWIKEKNLEVVDD